jgi:hypothetical protein
MQLLDSDQLNTSITRLLSEISSPLVVLSGWGDLRKNASGAGD